MEIRRRHVLLYVIVISLASLFVVSQSFDKWSRNDSINDSNREIINKYLTEEESKYLLDNNIDVNLFIKYIKEINFKLANYEYYDLLAKYNKKMNPADIVKYGNELVEYDFTLNYLEENFKSKSYSIYQLLDLAKVEESKDVNKIKAEFNPKDYLALANFEYYISTFLPNDLVQINSSYSYKKNKLFLRKEANEHLNLLCDNLTTLTKKTCGGLKVQDAFISYEEAKDNKKLASFVVAGQNSFQLGNTIAFNKNGLKNNEVYLWLLDNAYKYGYILRYPDNKEKVTNVSAQDNIFSYVGIEQAKEIYNKSSSVEEMRGD